MGYVTATQVLALNAQRRLSATSVPNASQVAQFIDETAAVIDAILTGRGFTLPIPTTATTALKLVEMANARMAYALVERSAPNSPHVEAAERMAVRAEEMVKSLEPPAVERDPLTTTARGGGTGSAMLTRTMVL